MGLLSALRDRLFGHAPASTGPDDATSTDTAASEPASPDATASDAMPQRSADQTPEAPASADAASPDAAVAARQERAASRLLEDERLRGDLTDDEFQPLLDWALAAADRLVASTSGLSDEQADERIDAGLSTIREAVMAAGDAVAAYAQHDQTRLHAALADAAKASHARSLSSLAKELAAKPDLSGSEVTALLAKALGSARPEAAHAAEGASS